MTATTAGPAPTFGPDEHEHIYQGQRLIHAHDGGEVEHGYYEHPEDPPKADYPA